MNFTLDSDNAGATAAVTGDTAPGSKLPFLSLTAAQVLAAFGNSLSAIAIPWFVLQTTGSTERTGFVAAASALAAVITLAFGSASVDRFGYRRMSIISDGLSMASVAMVPIVYAAGGLSFPVLIGLIFLGALLDSPGSTARTAMQPTLARLAGISLERANSVAQGVNSLAVLLAPVVGAFLISFYGASNVLWFNAGTFLLSMLIVTFLVPTVTLEKDPAQPQTSYLQDVRAGWAYLFRTTLVRAIASSAVIINFVTAPLIAVLLPTLIFRDVGNPHALGYMLGAYGAGELIGVALFGWKGEKLPRRLCLAGGIAAISSIPIAGAAGLDWRLMLPVMFFSGLTVGPINPTIFTVLQERVSPAMLGRVMGAVVASAIVATPLGLSLGGILVGWVGLTAVFVLISVILLGVSLWLIVTPALATIEERGPSAAVAAVDRVEVPFGR